MMINKVTKSTDTKENWDNKEIKDSNGVTVFRERLGQLRTESKASQESLSELLGVARQTFAKYETKNTASLPNIEQLCTICNYFQVSPNYLLGYSPISCDHKKNYGLSDTTINLLNRNPHIHHFLNYFVNQLAENNLEETISHIGITNNVETIWERVFPNDIITAIDNAYMALIKKAAYSVCINSIEMEKELRISFPKPKDFTTYFNKNLNQDGKNFILQDSPNFKDLSDQEQYDCFIKIISSHFVEVKSIQYVYHAEHEKISQKIIDIINNYERPFITEKNNELFKSY